MSTEGTIILTRPEAIASSERRTISLHLLIKNAASCIRRLLDNVGPYVDEISVVLNDTTDGTKDLIEVWCDEHGKERSVLEITSESHPGLYIEDVPETYRIGSPLVGEDFGLVPCTGRPILADWAGIRNLGWQRCTKDWRLFLDADDVVRDPECIPGLVVELERQGIEMACSRYVFHSEEDGGSRGEAFRERLAKNLPHLAWSGLVHEVLRGSGRTAHVDGNLVVEDRKDNSGAGVRIPGRDLKILYHHARCNDWMISPRYLLYLAVETQHVFPDLCLAAVELYLERSTWMEERAWACCLRGEVHEAREEWSKASEWFSRALREHPGSKAAFRLCRSKFREGKWSDAIEAYEMGVENKAVLQLLDAGPAYERKSLILVASAYDKLGKSDEAREFGRRALEAFPHNAPLKALVESFG